jgi:hypothetical protein
MGNRDQMIQALHIFKESNDHAKMRTLLETVAGVSAISQVPDDKIDAVIAATKNVPASNDEQPKSLADLHARAFQKWNAAGKRGEVT